MRPWCPRVIRPGSGRRTRSSARSERVAHRADRFRGADSRTRLASGHAAAAMARTAIAEIARTACSSAGPGRSGRSAAGQASAGRDRCVSRRARSVPAAAGPTQIGAPCPSTPASALATVAISRSAASAAHRPMSGQMRSSSCALMLCLRCGSGVVGPWPGRCRSVPTRGLRGGGGSRTSDRRRAIARPPARGGRLGPARFRTGRGRRW